MEKRTRGRDRIGQRFGHLTITEVDKGYAKCVCDCGREHRVQVANLCSNSTKTCGNRDCEYAVKVRAESCGKHHLSGTRLYHIWGGMINRCYSQKNPGYMNYGGRGISVCDSWKSDFLAFRAWALENGYEDHLTIDRIDNNGNYEPGNCRWVTYSVQNTNQRERSKFDLPHRIMWEIDGVTKSRKTWCLEYGIGENTAIYRVEVKGMSPKEALTTPLSSQGRKKNG